MACGQHAALTPSMFAAPSLMVCRKSVSPPLIIVVRWRRKRDFLSLYFFHVRVVVGGEAGLCVCEWGGGGGGGACARVCVCVRVSVV